MKVRMVDPKTVWKKVSDLAVPRLGGFDCRIVKGLSLSATWLKITREKRTEFLGQLQSQILNKYQ